MSKQIVVPMIAVALAIGAGCWVISRGREHQARPDNIAATSTPATANREFLDSLPKAGVLSIPNIDTTNWKIYRNEVYGFEIKYPDHTEPRKACDGGLCVTVSEWFAREGFAHNTRLVFFNSDPNDTDTFIELVNSSMSDSMEQLKSRWDLGSSPSQPKPEVVTIDERPIIAIYGEENTPHAYEAYLYSIDPLTTIILYGKTDIMRRMVGSIRGIK